MTPCWQRSEFITPQASCNTAEIRPGEGYPEIYGPFWFSRQDHAVVTVPGFPE